MADNKVSIRNFSGGLSQDPKFGQANSFGPGSQAVDFRLNQSSMGLLKRFQDESSSFSGFASINAFDGKDLTTPATVSEVKEVIARIKPTSWTSGAFQIIFDSGSGGILKTEFGIGATGLLVFDYWDSSAPTRKQSLAASAAVGIADGTAGWVRVTYDLSTNEANFYKAADGASVPGSWTQIGTTVTGSNTTAGSAFTAESIIGSSFSVSHFIGRIYRVIANQTISGTTVLDFNPGLDAVPGLLTFTSSATGEVYTASASSVLFGSSLFTAEPLDAVRAPGGDVYIVTENELAVRSPSSNGAPGTYDVVSADGAGTDLFYHPIFDTLFIFNKDVGISTFAPVTNSPALHQNHLSVFEFVNQTTTGGTYALLTSITEDANDEVPISASAVDPLLSAVFIVNAKGTGNWTATLHDSANNVIKAVTILNASVPSSGAITFNFGSRLKLGNDYHIHLTVSTGTSSIVTDTTNELPGFEGILSSSRLIDSPYHHLNLQFGPDLLFLNEKYLGQWEFDDLSGTVGQLDGYNPYALEFPPGYVGCGIANYSEYVAVGLAVDDSVDILNLQPTSGLVALWNGTDSTFDVTLPVPEGVPESLFSYRNALYWIANGVLYTWAGNDIQPIYRFPGMDNFSSGTSGVEVDAYLRAPRIGITADRGVIHCGFPGLTANVNAEYGIYSYGSIRAGVPDAIGKDYLMSFGSESVQFDTGSSPNVPITSITFVKRFGTTLLIGWHDWNGTEDVFGMDYLNELSPYTTSASWRALVFDNEDPDIEKTPKAVKITFGPLPANSTLTPVVNYDRGTDITGIDSENNPIAAHEGDIDIVLPLDVQNGFYEAAFGYDFQGDGANNIEVRSVTFKFDDNRTNTQATESRKGLPDA